MKASFSFRYGNTLLIVIHLSNLWNTQHKKVGGNTFHNHLVEPCYPIFIILLASIFTLMSPYQNKNRKGFAVMD